MPDTPEDPSAFETPAAAGPTAAPDPKPPVVDEQGELVVFPGMDLRRIAAALDCRKRTGKSYQGAPD